jgi:branched-chain amino acid transport system substrate-binding protein
MIKTSFVRSIGAAAFVGILILFAPQPSFAQDLVIGTSVPLAGPLAQFGEVIRDGYQFAADELNAKGGITINGTAHKIKLIVLDNQGDANQVAGQVRKLVESEKAVALLGAVTPVFNGPLSAAADQLKIPLVMTLVPIDAWQNARKDGYKYAWDIYAHEPEATKVTWKTADMAATNKKVVIFINTDGDGEIWGKNWMVQAEGAGYEVVYVAKMPVGTINFADYINSAKSAGAEIALGQMVPPDAIALWKQMKALGYAPKIASCEKCGSGDWWPGVLGPVAEGTLTSDIWVRGLGGPQATAVVKALGEKYKGKVLTGAVASHTVFNVMVDAIVRAGSTNPEAINAEIAKTDQLYGIGHVKFTVNHGSPVPPIMLQWQKGQALRVYPRDETSAVLEVPMLGLQ